MDKRKLGVIFGGMSTEHDISIVSGTSVISNLDKKKYDIFPIYIDKNGIWYKFIDINKKYNVGDEIITKIAFFDAKKRNINFKLLGKELKEKKKIKKK